MPIQLAPQFTQRTYSWTNWKTVQSAKNLVYQYDDDGIVYTIWGYDGPEIHVCTIWKGVVPDGIINSGYSQAQNDADKTGFETNFKPTANATLALIANNSSSGNLGALNATVQVTLVGLVSSNMQLAAGTLIGTIVPEVSLDGGTTWIATYFENPTSKVLTTSLVFASSNTTAVLNIVLIGGATQARVRVSVYTSGTASCGVRSIYVTNETPIYGTDGSNIHPVLTDNTGKLLISPNNPINAFASDVTTTGTLNAVNTNVQQIVQGESNAGMQLAAGTLIGTIVPEVSVDGGTTWVPTFFIDPATGNKVSSIVFASSNAATTRAIVGVGGSSHVRVRVSVFTSGAASCSIRASVFNQQTLLSEGSAASALPPAIGLVGGSDGTLLRAISTDTFGHIINGDIGYAAAAGLIAGATSAHRFGFSSGAGAPQDLRATAYTEQTTAAIRSFKSSSANDTAAGTGARTVTIVGYNAALTTKISETVTLNGVTAVATTNSYAFIESLRVAAVGSGKVNAGVITLFVNNAGGGGTIGTIGVGTRNAGGDNQTFWAHHYVISGKTMYIMGMSTSMSGVTSGQTLVKSVDPTTANTVELVITPMIGTRQAMMTYPFRILVAVVGPARVTMYNTATGGNEVDGSFEFMEF